MHDGFLGNHTCGWKFLRNTFWPLLQSLVVAAGGALWGTRAMHYGFAQTHYGFTLRAGDGVFTADLP